MPTSERAIKPLIVLLAMLLCAFLARAGNVKRDHVPQAPGWSEWSHVGGHTIDSPLWRSDLEACWLAQLTAMMLDESAQVAENPGPHIRRCMQDEKGWFRTDRTQKRR